MKVLCIDIGNTHTHFALIGEDGEPVTPRQIATVEIERTDNALYREVESLRQTLGEGYGISFCSVVPAAGEALRKRLSAHYSRTNLFQLTHKTLPPEVRLHYPRPEEIGQDRLANAAAAVFFHRPPCVVVDMGTAVTFDIISAGNGYEGGIIAPGIGVMTGYLHRQTALLPQLSEKLEVTGAIGKSTRQAMTIGCVTGFRGMLEALVRAVVAELAAQGETNPRLILTGGCAEFLFRGSRDATKYKDNTLAGIEALNLPDLTLQGLAVTFRSRNST